VEKIKWNEKNILIEIELSPFIYGQDNKLLTHLFYLVNYINIIFYISLVKSY